MPEYLRLAEVAKHLNVSKVTLWRKTKAGLLPTPIKLGVNSLIIKSELDAVMAAYKKACSEDEIRALITDLIAQR